MTHKALLECSRPLRELDYTCSPLIGITQHQRQIVENTNTDIRLTSVFSDTFILWVVQKVVEEEVGDKTRWGKTKLGIELYEYKLGERV